MITLETVLREVEFEELLDFYGIRRMYYPGSLIEVMKDMNGGDLRKGSILMVVAAEIEWSAGQPAFRMELLGDEKIRTWWIDSFVLRTKGHKNWFKKCP